MPRFYHSSDADLSDLNMAKRAVNRDYAKQYHSQDGNHDNLGQTQDVDAIYNALSTKLTSLYGTLSDLYIVLVAPVEIVQGGDPIKRFSTQLVGSLGAYSSRIISECRAIITIMTRIKTFNMFTPPQAEALSVLISDIDTRNADIFGLSEILGSSLTAQTIAGILAQYEGDYKTMMQLLNGASNSYKAIATKPAGEGLIGSGRMIGGYSLSDTFQDIGDFGRAHKDNVYAWKVADDYAQSRRGGAIVPAFNGRGEYGSDGYRVGDYYTYTDPRRFY